MMENMTEQKGVMREVDTQEYLGMLKELILEGREVSLLVTGSSMSPFIIHKRDSVLLAPVREPLKKGDIVFFQREDKSYVLHRIRCANGDGTFDIIGDGQMVIEKNVSRGQIFAIVTAVRRKGRDIRPGDFWWGFFARIWLRIIPLRPVVTRVYALGRGK